MKRLIDGFYDFEDGGATVDWVVLTAAVMGLMLAALITFNTGIVRHADLTGQTMQDRGIPTF